MSSRRLKNIIAMVAAARGMTADDLVGRRLVRRIVRPRQEAMWLARQLTGLSLPQIGAAFGGRDHSTVLQGLRAVEGRRSKDIAFAGRLDRMRTRIEAAQAKGLPA